MPADHIVWGTAYYPDHWPEAAWADDLARIRDAGIERVRFGEFSWSWYEPEPRRLDLDRFDRFVDLIETCGLTLCLCTPTATPPPWMDELFPDGRLEDMHGRRCLSHRHFWCWNHPGARAKAEETIAALVDRYGSRPSVWGWQIDNEPNYAEQVRLGDPESMYDWNPHSRIHFARWLERRYERVDALNTAWWTNFWSQRVRSWSEAARPRGRTNPHAWLDFMRWREANVAEQIRWQANLLRRICPRARVGTNIPETGVTLSVNIGQDYWRQAQALDWVGTDLYQATGDLRHDVERLAFSTDLMRSAAEAAGAEFLVAETQGGAHVRAWPNSFAGAPIGPEYLKASAECYVTRGAAQVWWFLWRPTLGGNELGMNGVQTLGGENSERTKMVRKLATRAWSRNRAAWGRRAVAHVHYSRDSLLQRTAFTADLADLQASYEGWHTLLEHLGYRVRFVDDAELTTCADARVLVAPHSIVCTPAVIRALAQRRAVVICGPHTGACDERGQLLAEGFPSRLCRRFGVVPGLWRDVGVLPRLGRMERVAGYRSLAIGTRSRIWARYHDRQIAAAGTQGAWIGFDLGRHYASANAQHRRVLRTLIGAVIEGGR